MIYFGSDNYGINDIEILADFLINKKDTGGNIPVKCFESWASGIPVLLSNIEDAEVSEIFKKCGSGILVDSDNVEALVNGLDDLLSKDLKELGIIGRNYVIENFDRRKQSRKLIKTILT